MSFWLVWGKYDIHEEKNAYVMVGRKNRDIGDIFTVLWGSVADPDPFHFGLLDPDPFQ